MDGRSIETLGKGSYSAARHLVQLLDLAVYLCLAFEVQVRLNPAALVAPLCCNKEVLLGTPE